MSSFSYQRLAVLCRYAMMAGAVLFVLVLISRDVVLSGKLTINHSFDRPDAFATELVPVQRVQIQDGGALVVDEPVYTTLRYPRPFQSVNLSVEFLNEAGLLLEAGPQAEAFESYDLLALDHPQLNKIFQRQEVWTGAESAQDSRLYQKRSAPYIYKSIEQFGTELPDKQYSGYYGVTWPKPYLPDFTKRGLPQTVTSDIPLRGSHEFYVATAADALRFEVELQDMNNQAGPDDVRVTIFDWQGNVLAEEMLSDDGHSEENAPTSFLRKVRAEVVGLPKPDVYRVAVSATDDIVIRRLTVDAPYLVVKGHLSVAGGPVFTSEFGPERAYPISLVTSSRVWTAQTTHTQSLQTIAVEDEALNVEQPYQAYTYRLARGRDFKLDLGYALSLEKGNVVIDGRGVFAFDQRSYFTPLPWLIDDSADIDVLNLNYIVTEYLPPARDPETGVLTQNISIDLREVFAPNKSLRIQFAAPDLQPGQTFSLLRARMAYEAEPVTLKNAWTKLQRFWAREIAN
jgi:hypothetical protein